MTSPFSPSDHRRPTVRDLADHDLAAVHLLNNASVPHLSELDPGEAARLASLASCALVAQVSGGVSGNESSDESGGVSSDAPGEFAGFCWALAPGQPYDSLNYRWFSDRYPSFVYLDRIAVHPRARRMGVARLLYHELITRAAGHYPVLLCEVNVQPANDASMALHTSLGFREVGRQHTDGGAKTVSLLELPLSS